MAKSQNLVTDWVVGMEDAHLSAKICHICTSSVKSEEVRCKLEMEHIFLQGKSFGVFKGVGFGSS